MIKALLCAPRYPGRPENECRGRIRTKRKGNSSAKGRPGLLKRRQVGWFTNFGEYAIEKKIERLARKFGHVRIVGHERLLQNRFRNHFERKRRISQDWCCAFGWTRNASSCKFRFRMRWTKFATLMLLFGAEAIFARGGAESATPPLSDPATTHAAMPGEANQGSSVSAAGAASSPVLLADDPASLLGAKIVETIGRFGAPNSVYAVRGAEAGRMMSPSSIHPASLSFCTAIISGRFASLRPMPDRSTAFSWEIPPKRSFRPSASPMNETPILSSIGCLFAAIRSN